MLRFTLVETETSFPLRVVLCTETETLLIERKENMTKVKVNKDNFYFVLGRKPNVDTIVISVSMWKQHDFETILNFNDVMNIQVAIVNAFFLEKYHTIWE